MNLYIYKAEFEYLVALFILFFHIFMAHFLWDWIIANFVVFFRIDIFHRIFAEIGTGLFIMESCQITKNAELKNVLLQITYQMPLIELDP